MAGLGLNEIIGILPVRGRRDLDRVQPLHLIPDVALPQRDIDHRRLDVLVSHRFLDGERVRPGHGHLLSEGVAAPQDVNL